MESLNDQFNHGRIPIKPIPYKDRNLSQCNEILIDYGEDGTYHIYITHHNDPNKYIDITALIVKEMLPKAEINANQFTITIKGNKDPQSLMDIINFIYKRFTYADDPSGFVFERDRDKLFDPTTINVLLKTTDGQIQLPVTIADNVYDKNGISIQDRLNNNVKLGFSTTYLYTTQQDQTSYEFEYPFEDYPDMLEVRIGTTYVDNTRYSITKHYDSEGHYRTGTLTFIGEGIENGRRIDLVWIFNTVYNDGGKLEFISGSKIADSTIPICKLEKYSNSYSYPDSNSVATSKALSNLYVDLTESINANNQNLFHCLDRSFDNNNSIRIDINRAPQNNDIFIVALNSNKTSAARFIVGYDHCISPEIYSIKMPDGSNLIRGFRNNQILKFKITDGIAVILSGVANEIRSNKYIHNCVDQEYDISFKDLEYNTGDLIHVYRNGVRLFQDLDYSVNTTEQTITLFVRTEQGERIVFESIGV